MGIERLARRRASWIARAALAAIPLVGVAAMGCSGTSAPDANHANDGLGDPRSGGARDGAALDLDAAMDRCPVPTSVRASLCGAMPAADAQVTDAAAPKDAAGIDAGTLDADLGGADDGEGDPGYADPLLDPWGPDDQCKYFLRLSPTALVPNQPVTFTLDGALLADRTPMTNAKPRIEAFLDDGHPLAVPAATSTESTPGHYTIGPVTFDAAGVWTVRFHFYDSCTSDAPDSPAGHVAFALTVGSP